MVGRRLLSLLSTNDAILGPRGIIPEGGRGGSVGQGKGKEEEPPDCGAYTEVNPVGSRSIRKRKRGSKLRIRKIRRMSSIFSFCQRSESKISSFLCKKVCRVALSASPSLSNFSFCFSAKKKSQGERERTKKFGKQQKRPQMKFAGKKERSRRGVCRRLSFFFWESRQGGRGEISEGKKSCFEEEGFFLFANGEGEGSRVSYFGF